MPTRLDHNINMYNYDDRKEWNGTSYLLLVGSIKHLTTTRPDIKYLFSIIF